MALKEVRAKKFVQIICGAYVGTKAEIIRDHESHAMLYIPGMYINIPDSWFVRL